MGTETARALGGLLQDLTNAEIYALTDSGNRPALKEFLAARMAQAWRQVSYDQSVGLVPLIKRAVEDRNLKNIRPDINQERFRLAGTGVRTVQVRVESYLNGETSEEAAVRLTAAGCKFGNTGDLAAFLHDHPEEVERWGWVLAINEDSRWASPGGEICVPCALVHGAVRLFGLCDFRRKPISAIGVLVLSE